MNKFDTTAEYSRERANPVKQNNRVNLKRFTNAELEEISESKTCNCELCLVMNEIRRRLPVEQRETEEEKRNRLAETKFFGVSSRYEKEQKERK